MRKDCLTVLLVGWFSSPTLGIETSIVWIPTGSCVSSGAFGGNVTSASRFPSLTDITTVTSSKSNTLETLGTSPSSSPVFSTYSMSMVTLSLPSSISSTGYPKSEISIATMAQSITGQQSGVYAFEGCFATSSTAPLLTGQSVENPNLTLQYCAGFCASTPFFGVQNGNECVCGSSFNATNSTPLSCNVMCGGDNSEFCGAQGYVQIYSASKTNSGGSPSTSSTTNNPVSSSFVSSITMTSPLSTTSVVSSIAAPISTPSTSSVSVSSGRSSYTYSSTVLSSGSSPTQNPSSLTSFTSMASGSSSSTTTSIVSSFSSSSSIRSSTSTLLSASITLSSSTARSSTLQSGGSSSTAPSSSSSLSSPILLTSNSAFTTTRFSTSSSTSTSTTTLSASSFSISGSSSSSLLSSSIPSSSSSGSSFSIPSSLSSSSSTSTTTSPTIFTSVSRSTSTPSTSSSSTSTTSISISPTTSTTSTSSFSSSSSLSSTSSSSTSSPTSSSSTSSASTSSSTSSSTSFSSTSSSSSTSTATTSQASSTTACSSTTGIILLACPTPVVTNTNGVFDDSEFEIDLPFNLTLFAQNSSSIVVTTNGLLSIGRLVDISDSTTTNTIPPIPLYSQELVDGTACVWWEDLAVNTNTPQQGIWYQIDQQYGYPAVSVEYILTASGDTSGTLYHVIAQYTTQQPGAIFFYYFSTGDAGANATIGIQGSYGGGDPTTTTTTTDQASQYADMQGQQGIMNGTVLDFYSFDDGTAPYYFEAVFSANCYAPGTWPEGVCGD